MTFRYRGIELTVTTATRFASYSVDFADGLNVVQAPNSWGKSTLVQSLVYGLGLEGAFSASHLSPLGEAMTSVIDLDGQREAITQSSVTVTLENDHGELLRVRRFPRSLEYDSELVQTWFADQANKLDGAPRRDMYVRQGGSATHTLGFHRYLEEFAGLSLPRVPGFNSDEVKLYLEVLFPLFYVEQKYGWSGLAPRVPTQFRIRSPYRRAAEFALGLGTLERLKERESLSTRLVETKKSWEESSAELKRLVLGQGWEYVAALSDGGLIEENSPFGRRRNDEWVTAEDEVEELQRHLAGLDGAKLRTVGEDLSSSQAKLRHEEGEVARLSGRYRALSEQMTTADAELNALQVRQEELEHSRETLIDVRKLEKLGSEIDSRSIASAHCPTCAQALDSASVATGIVLDVAANLALLDAERATLRRMLAEAGADVDVAAARLGAARVALNEARARVRTLKDELTSPTDSPSVAQIEERLAARAQLRTAESVLATAYAILDDVNRDARAIVSLQQQLRALRGDEDAQDRAIVRRFSTRFTEALGRFGLRSLPVGEVTIGEDSLLPEHDGFELSFDIRHGLSASDTIRTKWAHYVAMAATAESEPTGSSLGVLILDEPRQQEAEFSSVRALYAELAQVSHGTQVIVASSADSQEMNQLLAGLNVNLVANVGEHMFSEGVPLTP
ncbi:hypothetical protein ACFVAJ_11120 [Agromyces sp. NPDC057679]|uniref:hypothetical protein n=1 Tax=Agromyces sp. NPDC057679 TaxID=3346207 RepID=UPI00366AC121